MRLSERPNERFGTLRITGPAGTEWTIEDVRFASIGSGVVPTELALPAGAYTIIWSAAGRSEEQLVEVVQDEVREYRGGDFPLGSAAPLPQQDERLETKQFKTAAALIRKKGSDSTELLVIVRSADDRPTSDLGRTIRLFGADGVRIRPKRPGRIEQDTKQFGARFYKAAPGCLTLQFLSNERRTLQQSIVALEGRRTVVFLRYGSAVVAESTSSNPRLRRRRGIAPGKSTIISTDLASEVRFDEHVRAAEIILHKLATSETIEDSSVRDLVSASSDDPLMRLYAAALGLRRSQLSADTAPTPSRMFHELLDGLSDEIPDVRCFRLALASASAASVAGASPFAAPPMLDVAWRWIAALSFSDPNLLSGNPAFAAAARETNATPPWLTWRSAQKPSQQKTAPMPESNADDVRKLAEQLTDSALRRANNQERTSERPSARGGGLAASTIEIANAAIRAVRSASASASIPLAEQIAFSTGVPATQLPGQLSQAIEDLESADDFSIGQAIEGGA